MKAARAAVLLLAAVWLGTAHAEPDEVILGKPQGYPVGNGFEWYSNPYRIGSWSAMDKVGGLRTRIVKAPATAQPLATAARPVPVRYRYRNLEYTLDEYLDRQRITGLLVLKDGEIVYERYRYDRQPDARFLSFSMAKSVTSLLVGIAASKGAIASLDDPAAKYASELDGSAYGATTVRQLLRMSSGLTFTERYDGGDDVARLSGAFARGTGTANVLRSITNRHSPAGEKFVYASGETAVLGRVLKGATGRDLTQLTREWLWEPIGAERDALWVVDPLEGIEGAWGLFNASLRDWARLGLLLARDGRVGDTQVVPREYVLDATEAARQPAAFRPRAATPFFGYGYQFWLLPAPERTFAMLGIHGQAVFVQPASGIVMVHTAAWLSARDDAGEERMAVWRGVLQSLGGR